MTVPTATSSRQPGPGESARRDTRITERAGVESSRLEAALRDLIWRVEHVRLLLKALSAAAGAENLAGLLDTSDARAVLRVHDGPTSRETSGGTGIDRGME